MNLDQALQTFVLESRELLEDMENALLAAGQQADTPDTINAIFRAAHTIKGSAGLFGLDHMVAFTHVVESLLDEVRDGSVALSEALVVLLLSCCDHLSGMVDRLAAGHLEADEAGAADSEALLRQLRKHLGKPAAPARDLPLAATPDPVQRIDGSAPEGDYWHISLRFAPGVLQNGMDPLAFLRYLGKLGRIAGIVTLSDKLPPADDMDAELCYLGFEIAFDSLADKAAIEGVFEFVQDDCELRILPPHSRVSEYIELIESLPRQAARLGEILVRCGSITERELQQALQRQQAGAERLGNILVDTGSVAPTVVAAALTRQQQNAAGAEPKQAENRSLRIDAGKLDRLIDLVGELIIAGARADMLGQRLRNPALQECTSVLGGLVEAVRDAALELRMVRIGATFNRFQRVVHDVARELGKDIGLSVSGEDAELDKTVVERIGDPLMHLVRNAMDHGIEPAEVRAARGKPARGMIHLNAFHDAGSIVIEVSDDGGGLNREKILAKAIERGLVDPERKLCDSEIDNLIFEAGFSTADTITNLSGRGVGMDVVKRNITALRGSVAVSSTPGAGATVTVRLPLTLAIIDGFQVQAGNSVFVIPLDMVEECIEYRSEPGQQYVNLRGRMLPFARLRSVFGIEGQPTRRESIVVLKLGAQRAGLLVDTLLGECQAVIKPLAPVFAGVQCISGSTILGSGEVALVIDVAALLALVNQAGAAPQPALLA